MSNGSDEYRPIGCSMYSQLELMALRKKPVLIRYERAGKTLQEEIVIQNLITRKGEEFLISCSSPDIRLDKIKDITSL